MASLGDVENGPEHADRAFWVEIREKIDNFGLREGEKRSILRKISDLEVFGAKIARLRTETEPPPVYVPTSQYTTWAQKRLKYLKHKGRLRGTPWWKDSRSWGPCSIGCPTPLPHRDKKAIHSHVTRQISLMPHVRAMRRAMILARGSEFQRAIAYEAYVRPARERRIIAFFEEAPHAAAALGRQGVERIVAEYPRDYSVKRFRRWVQMHYGGKPQLPRPGAFLTRAYGPGTPEVKKRPNGRARQKESAARRAASNPEGKENT